MKIDLKRGVLTDEIRNYMQDYLKTEVTQVELRLMPYLLNCLMNDGNLDGQKINSSEMKILQHWKSKGFINFERDHLVGFYKVAVKSKEFFIFITNVIWLGYIAKI